MIAHESPEALYEVERVLFNKSDPAAPPRLGVSFSGGGNRSAAFSIGVLRALHQKGLLNKVDVMSAVSGGSYALSWYLLQPFYYALANPGASLSDMQEAMFDASGRFQRYLENHARPFRATDRGSLIMLSALAGAFTLTLFNTLRVLNLLMSWIPGMQQKLTRSANAGSSAREDYRLGIQQTYQMLPDESGKRATNAGLGDFAEYRELLRLSASRPPVTFPQMRIFSHRVGLPSFVFNTTLRPTATGASVVSLRDAIFEIGSAGFGSDSCGFLAWEETDGLGWEPGMAWKGFNDRSSPFATLRNLNTAPAISGAAISDAGVARTWARWLLSVANLGLEYVVPKPSDITQTVRLSDGGHSENLGAFALLRRRCRTIVIVDGEYEPAWPYAFRSYHRLKAAAREDLGLDLTVGAIDTGTFSASQPICRGCARTPGKPTTTIYYVKPSIPPSLKDATGAIQGYARTHPMFPQESTMNQYFEQDRFKAYAALGHEIASTLPDNLGDEPESLESPARR